ncbi:PspA/IM30 family protein [Nocardia alni]|uniref:PspA/IM30 family protein n=1 Tax=Nocardia alni TaxID=2815723 RepID=UPI001C244671|nr:hypothetical protein [Nocardia alni]
MSDVTDLATLLAALPDEDLLSVVMAATTARPGLEPLHLVAVELSAQHAHVDLEPDVTSTTGSVGEALGGVPSTPFDQPGPLSAMPIPPAGIPETGSYSDSGVPTFESVRDKVERRFGTAQGMGELDSQTPAGRGIQDQWQARAKSARDRLDEIRKSMRRDDSGDGRSNG